MQIEMFNETIELEKALQEGEECYHCSGCNKTLPARKFQRYALKILRALHDPDTKSTSVSRGSGNATRCRKCVNAASKSRLIASQEAGPRPTEALPCECCGVMTEPKDIRMDHCHDTHRFRGWLCNTCNTGIGSMGDSIEGLERAINYLKKHYG